MKSIFICLLLIFSMQIPAFSQNPIYNPFTIFHGAKPKGKIDSVFVYRYHHEGFHAYLYIYNRHRQLIKCSMYRYFVNPHVGTQKRDTAKVTYVYNTAGKLVSRIYVSNGGKPEKIVYNYLSTRSGYALREISKDSTEVFEMRFNKLGQMLQSGSYKLNDPEQRLMYNFGYQYDNKGNLIRQINYYTGGIPNTSTYKYDSNGDEVDMYRSGQGQPRTDTYKYSNYDKAHNWTQKVIHFVIGAGEDTISYKDTIRRRITYHK